MSQRTPWSGPQKLKNNTGFGVIRIQVASTSKSTRAPLAGSDRPVLKYRGTPWSSCTRVHTKLQGRSAHKGPLRHRISLPFAMFIFRPCVLVHIY